jgi:hypothetical protein
MNFSLTPEELTKIKTWEAQQDAKILEKQKFNKEPFIQHLTENNIPYYGAIGGSLTYCFTPNGLGVVIIIKHCN